MSFTPLHDRILVQRTEADTKSAGGILLPDNAQEKPQKGKVVSIGPGSRDTNGKLHPVQVRVGDTILFGKFTGNEIKINAQDFLIIKESDVLGIFGR